jgi:hypothetical protein
LHPTAVTPQVRGVPTGSARNVDGKAGTEWL